MMDRDTSSSSSSSRNINDQYSTDNEVDESMKQNYAPSILITMFLQNRFISCSNDEDEVITNDIEREDEEEEEDGDDTSRENIACDKHHGRCDIPFIGKDESNRIFNSLSKFLVWLQLQQSKQLHVIHILKDGDNDDQDQDHNDYDPASTTSEINTSSSVVDQKKMMKKEKKKKKRKSTRDLLMNLNGIDNELNNQIHFIEISGVNAFRGTNLHQIISNILQPQQQSQQSSKDNEAYRPRISVVGVHTESSIQFLMYELYSRFPFVDLATCSALTASRSRMQHFNALSQMNTIFNVQIHDSTYDFEHFILTHDRVTPTLEQEMNGIITSCTDQKKLKKYQQREEGADDKEEEEEEMRDQRLSNQYLMCGIQWDTIGQDKSKISTIDKELICSLYRDSSTVTLKKLSGGNTSSWVFRVSSTDMFDNRQSTTVLKIGDRRRIVKERVNFERVEDILGNNAPRLQGFAEYNSRAGIKFAYASMLEEGIDAEQASFRSLYFDDVLRVEELKDILKNTFVNVIGRFYAGATLERIDLFKAYDFDGKGWNYKIGGTDNPQVVKKLVLDHFATLEEAQIFSFKPCGDRDSSNSISARNMSGNEPYLKFPGGLTVSNPVHFFETSLPWIKEKSYLTHSHHYVAYQHGDLHGRNIILDHAFNVWLIDFEYTERTHILKDIAKIENDVLYEYTPINDLDTLKQALLITQELLSVRDLALPLPESIPGVTDPGLKKAWTIVVYLRSIIKDIVKDDRSSFQMEVVLLRYSLFSVTLPQLSPLQKAWALASCCGFAQLIEERAVRNKSYHLDFIRLTKEHKKAKAKRKIGKLALSILPGRRDRRGSLKQDISVMKEDNISNVLCLSSDFELDRPRKDSMMEAMNENDIGLRFSPIPKGVIPSISVTKELCEWLFDCIDKKHQNVCIVSSSGLGRAGMIAACYLMFRDHSTDAKTAIELVREGRGERAVDSEAEVKFVESFYKYLKDGGKSADSDS